MTADPWRNFGLQVLAACRELPDSASLPVAITGSAGLFSSALSVGEMRAELGQHGPTVAIWTYTVTMRVNLRPAPNTVYDPVGQLEPGQMIEVGEARNGWLRVLKPEGWIVAAAAKKR